MNWPSNIYIYKYTYIHTCTYSVYVDIYVLLYMYIFKKSSLVYYEFCELLYWWMRPNVSDNVLKTSVVKCCPWCWSLEAGGTPVLRLWPPTCFLSAVEFQSAPNSTAVRREVRRRVRPAAFFFPSWTLKPTTSRSVVLEVDSNSKISAFPRTRVSFLPNLLDVPTLETLKRQRERKKY